MPPSHAGPACPTARTHVQGQRETARWGFKRCAKRKCARSHARPRRRRRCDTSAGRSMSRCHGFVIATQWFGRRPGRSCQSRTASTGIANGPVATRRVSLRFYRQNADAPPRCRVREPNRAAMPARPEHGPGGAGAAQNLTLRRAVSDDSSRPVWPAAFTREKRRWTRTT
jgi:hypothetical protein